MISGVILAAGRAKRMGRQKLLLNLKGKPVLQWVLEAAVSSALEEVICVVREIEEIERKISVQHAKLRWISNENASKGQSTSIIAGLNALSPQSDGALFLVGDQPLIRIDLINGLIDLSKERNALVVAPVLKGETRNPVLFHRTLFPELLGLTGDRGGKGLMQKYREQTALLEWEVEEPFLDIDVWEDYEEIKKRRPLS